MSRARSFSKLINKDNYATYRGSDSVSDISAVSLPQGTLNFRNKIINGDMRIAQRYTSIGPMGSGVANFFNNYYYACDRFLVDLSDGSATLRYTASQVNDAPSSQNFDRSIKMHCTTGITIAALTQFKVEYRVEGYDAKYFGFGTSNNKYLTLSFWFKSSVAGKTSVAFVNSDNNRCYIAPFIVDTANVWEKKIITFQADDGGTWLVDNGIGLRIRWGTFGSDWQTSDVNQWLAQNKISTTDCIDYTQQDRFFQITGVQLEEGSVATPFEHRPYGLELSLCQRYFYKFDSTDLDDLHYARSPYASGTPPNTTASVTHFHPVTMRANPTIIANVNGGTLNRKTATQSVVVFQWASTSTNGAYAVTDYTASIEL